MPYAPDLAGHALDNRYELHDVLGEGAFGRVYRGFDRRLERVVAVKVIKPWWAEDSGWVERFQREARMLARVSGPGVVQIFDIGDAEEGPYYVAELVEGESLADRLARGRLPVEEARSVAEQLCEALASAHREGVVHCDVKPSNVLLTGRGAVKVADFGVARLVRGTSLALATTVAGTPRYMSPEQARGMPTGAATDVYSAGVVLYEMLAGRPPFEDGSAVELGLRHVQDPPPALPADVPRQLREVVERALAKDPARRYRDAGSMAQALRGTAAPIGGARPPRTPAVPRGAAPLSSVQTVHIDGARRGGDGPAATWVLAGDPAAPPPPPPRSGRRLDTRGRRGLFAGLAIALLLAGSGLVFLLLAGQRARTTVPQLQGLPRGGVKARSARLHVVPAFSKRFSEAPSGTAIAQAPTAGARVVQGSTVNVTLSAGPPPVAVPSVVGQPAASAENHLANAGLRYAINVVVAPRSTPGAVVRQAPGPVATAPRGSTVTLSVAEAPRWRALTSFSGVDDGRSVPFRILGYRWRVSYRMAFRGTCLLLIVCGGPSATATNLGTASAVGHFELGEGEAQTHVFDDGPGLYRLALSGGRDSARWSMTVEDYY